MHGPLQHDITYIASLQWQNIYVIYLMYLNPSTVILVCVPALDLIITVLADVLATLVQDHWSASTELSTKFVMFSFKLLCISRISYSPVLPRWRHSKRPRRYHKILLHLDIKHINMFYWQQSEDSRHTCWWLQVTTRTTRTPVFWGYPPPPHDHPYYWVILDPKSKEDKVKITNLKNSPKFQIYEFGNKHYMQHTFISCLIRCANMKWIQWVLLKIQSGHDSVHRRTRWNQYTPLSTSLKRGI